MKVEFHRADQRTPDNGVLPAPLTWDYCVRYKKAGGFWAAGSGTDLALVTCQYQHTLRLSSLVHKVSADGLVTPSYVCVAKGCSFHVMPWRLIGWDPNHVYEFFEV